jgi:hypothetical protein
VNDASFQKEYTISSQSLSTQAREPSTTKSFTFRNTLEVDFHVTFIK